ncbi:MAG TPA: hypothetical protein VGS57_02675 [Thermoanaerobaculia bacterium]|nr:hypothetical protein [Thermoanaerobaculia bacterium]
MASPLVDQALSGTNRPLTLLAARGMLPLAPEELVPLQVQLAGGGDPEVAEAAFDSLKALAPRVLVPFLARDAPPEVQRWYAYNSRDREVVETLLRRRDVPAEVLFHLAPQLGADLQEVLLLRQDRISTAPELLAALETNPQLSAYSQRRIREYRDHLLGGAGAAAAEARAAAAAAEEAEEREVEEALAVARRAAPDGEVDEQTGLTEGQIRQLPVTVRLKLARRAPKSLRQFLVRDTSPLVAVAVLQSNPLSDTEIEMYARSRSVVPEVLDYIVKQRQWIAKYPVVVAIVNNPRTPLNVALPLMSRLSVRDLRIMCRDRNLPDAVRQSAMRLFRVKSV